MANGTTPPRNYDLPRARTMLERTRASIKVEASSSLERGLLGAMAETLDLLEATHGQLTLLELTGHQLWAHLDGLNDQLRRHRGLRTLGNDIAAANVLTDAEIAAALAEQASPASLHEDTAEILIADLDLDADLKHTKPAALRPSGPLSID